MIVDTHAHLTSVEFENDIEQVLAEAKASGIAAIVCVSEDLFDAKKALALGQKHELVRPGAGLFPTVLEQDRAQEVYEFILQHQGVLSCIGEVGLDFWKVQNAGDRETQEEIFRGFVRLSIQTGLPINCHSRSAGRRIIEILLEEGAQRVQLHAFDAKAGTALKGQEAGFFFSIPPSVVRSRQKQKLVKALPLESLLVESDAPVLGPEPKVRNEPHNVRLAIRVIAELKGLPEDKVREITLENTMRLYGDKLCLKK